MRRAPAPRPDRGTSHDRAPEHARSCADPAGPGSDGPRNADGRGWPRGHGFPPPDRRDSPAGAAVLVTLIQVIITTLTDRGQAADLDPLGYALLALSGLALGARRRHPVLTLAFVGAATLAYTVLDYPTGPTFVALIVAGLSAVKSGQRYPVWAIVAVGYPAWVLLAEPDLRRALVIAAWVVGLLLVGELARVAGRAQSQAAEARAERARAQDEQQRRQASEERLRIAQELHDVLGHHLSLINVQAGVGLHLMDNQPEQAREALGAIKLASAEALREVRSVIASLHAAGEAAPRTPAPGLDRLDELTVDAGLPVDTVVAGAARPLPPEVDRAAYRIVREALTNVRRHAGGGVAATVVIEYRPEELVVRVEDDGGGATPVAGPVAEGTGIGGMRERAAALGGSLIAEPRTESGFRVAARLPLPAESPDSAADPGTPHTSYDVDGVNGAGGDDGAGRTGGGVYTSDDSGGGR